MYSAAINESLLHDNNTALSSTLLLPDSDTGENFNCGFGIGGHGEVGKTGANTGGDSSFESDSSSCVSDSSSTTASFSVSDSS